VLVKRSSGSAEPKFRREPPEARREKLVAATLACLRKFGHEGVSVRRISAEAGVSMGLINHHFPGIAGLVAAAYDTLATTLLAASREHALASDGEPLERLNAFFRASFAPESLDPALFRTWLVFWSLVPHSPEMRIVHDRTYGETRATLEALLGRLKRGSGVPSFRIASAAIGLAALMDGLWVELSLNPATFEADEAVALCDDWVQALAAGAFPALRAPRRG
jgi:AcrR family transcriptional regulator